MSDVLSEGKADKQVIKSLLRHIKHLQERNIMGKILFDENGDIYRATSFERLSQEDLERELGETQEKMKDIQESIDFSNKLQQKVSETAAPEQVSEPTPVVVPSPEPQAEATEGVASEAPKADEPAAPIDPATAPAPAPIVLE